MEGKEFVDKMKVYDIKVTLYGTRPAAASCSDDLRKGFVSCGLVVGTVSRAASVITRDHFVPLRGQYMVTISSLSDLVRKCSR